MGFRWEMACLGPGWEMVLESLYPVVWEMAFVSLYPVVWKMVPEVLSC